MTRRGRLTLAARARWRTSSPGSSAPRRSTRPRPGSCSRRSRRGRGSRLARRRRSAAPPRRQRRAARGRRRLGDAPGAAAGARAAARRSSSRSGSPGSASATTPLRRDGRFHRGTYVLERVPRGRYAVEEARARSRIRSVSRAREVELAAGGALVVYPRLVALDRLFSESGAHAQDGRRLLLRRPSGFDLHSVREYEHGESLRKVHWPTTARRGQLMVKELEDAPRDEIAVVLDADAARGRGGELRRAGARGRLDPPRARLPRPPGRARAQLGDAPDARASRRSRATGWPRSSCSRRPSPTGRGRSSSCSRARAGRPARALETVVVTARVSGALATRLVQRALAGPGRQRRLDRRAELRRPADAVEPELLRLQAAGVAVAVVRARRLARRGARRSRRREEAHG